MKLTNSEKQPAREFRFAPLFVKKKRQEDNDGVPFLHRRGSAAARRLFARALVVAVVGGWTAAAQAAQSLFESTERPQTESVADTRATELGVRFTSSQEGVVTGVRFYKGPKNRGTHTGSLWTGSGQRLATGVFQNETDSGWQTLTFAKPIPIKADTVYVASYWTPTGGYARDRNYFRLARHSGPLTALAGNGVFRIGSSGFPQSSHQRSNYWVDVLFEGVTPPPTSPTPPPTAGTVPDGYTLAWADEFDDLSLSAANGHRWAPYFVGWNVRHLAGNNDEAVKYADDETVNGGAKAGQLLQDTGLWGTRSGYLHETAGGRLAIRGYPIVESQRPAFWGFPYVAGMISGQKSHSQRYGYWETRVRMTNVSKGHHFAIWLLPDDNSWPPEIDMLEVVGQHQDLIFVNAHGSGRTMTTHQVSSITDDWYVVGFHWTPTTMRWTINRNIVREHPNYITGKNLYMLMSWEIGSNWPGKPDGSTKWPAEVLVDYVRIYRSDNSS